MVSNNDASIVYFEGSPVLFTSKKTNGTKPSQKPPSLEEEKLMAPIAEWGNENTFPLQARKKKESNPDLASALDWKARALYAGGIKFNVLDRFSKQPVALSDDIKRLIYEIDSFTFRNRHYLLQASIDFYDLFNVFPQIILSEDRKKITRIAAIEAQDCRYKKRESNGSIRQVFIHPDWEAWSGQEDDKKLIKVPLINPLNANPEEIKEKRGDAFKYFYPLSYPTGKNYYQLPHWWTLIVSEWLNLANMIPEMKTSILKNLALIRYHIEMPDYWMSDRYKNWNSMNDDEKKKAVEKEFKIINDVLTNPGNAGKSIFTMFKTMVASGKEYGGWKINAVDDKMKDGALLADSSEATIKIFSATSIDPSLHGLIPGTGGSNRSGSDKREALNIYMSLIQSHEDILMDPWNFAAWYNGWNSEDIEVKFYIEKPILQTLNQVTPAQRATIPQNDAD